LAEQNRLYPEGFLTEVQRHPYKLLALLVPFVGLVAVAAMSRARQDLAAWAFLLGDWLLVALGQWYFLIYEAPHHMNDLWRQAHPPTASTVWGLMPHPALAFSLALLLCMQLLSAVRSRRAEMLGPKVQRCLGRFKMSSCLSSAVLENCAPRWGTDQNGCRRSTEYGNPHAPSSRQ